MAKLKNNLNPLNALILSLLILGGAAVFAQRQYAMIERGRPEVKIALSGIVERPEGKISVDKIAAVTPGDVLDWTITSQNGGTAPAREYKAIGQIPTGTSFVEGSATADGTASVSYSIDGGKVFSARPVKEEKQADGSVRQVPAPVSMYTQVRYEWSDSLAANAKLSASYKVRVN